MGTSWGFTLSEGLGTWAPPGDSHSVKIGHVGTSSGPVLSEGLGT